MVVHTAATVKKEQSIVSRLYKPKS